MAQFRTTADILDEILQKAGEPTNGNSPFESIALTYANKVHHAIIGGGNIFNLEVDEPWVWARARAPIILELEPAYTTGTITFTNDDVNFTFSSSPVDSLEGWHLQVNGKSTVYKITKHNALDSQGQLDSSFIDDSGVYNFRVFKLDYEVLPTYLYIDSKNDRIDFQETASATLSTTLTHGAYTPLNLISHVAAQIDAAGANAYVGTWDSVLKRNMITRTTTTAGTFFNMLGASGANKQRSVLPLIGFDRLDQTGNTTYTSAYTPNSISRLIEPFKIFTGSFNINYPGYGRDPFIYSTDPIRMQKDYPLASVREKVPDRFVRLTEENDGTVWVRFNAYPPFKTKVSIDWIPTPIDLQDNTASFPELPRSDVDTLIHGAAAYIAFDKEDNKWEGFLNLTKTALQSMQKRNRSQLFRTGDNFAQIVPRADLDYSQRRFDFGYTVSGSTASQTTAESVQSMIAVTLNYSDFQTASTVSTVTARQLPANRSLFALIVKHSTSFTGSLMSAARLDVGISGDPTKFINSFDVQQVTAASAQDSSLVIFYPAAATDIQVRMTSVGANLSALTQGSITLYFQETIVT